jgi:NTE family protein
MLKPAVENVRWYEFHRVSECIQAGEAVGRQVAEEIKILLKTWDLAGRAVTAPQSKTNGGRRETGTGGEREMV